MLQTVYLSLTAFARIQIVITQHKQWTPLWVKGVLSTIGILLHLVTVAYFTTPAWALVVLSATTAVCLYFYTRKLRELRYTQPGDDAILRSINGSGVAFTSALVFYLVLVALFIGGPLSQRMLIESVREFPLTALILVLGSIPQCANLSTVVALVVYLYTKKNGDLRANVPGI
jgi:hypothetical protein